MNEKTHMDCVRGKTEKRKSFGKGQLSQTRDSSLLIFLLLLFAAIALAAPVCSGEELETQQESAIDLSGDDDDLLTDSDTNDDDDFWVPAEVTVEDPPEGNPLARKLTVRTESEMTISGYLTTQGESGYAPSYPSVSGPAVDHEFWFYGLLEETKFSFRFYEIGNPATVIAEGSFETPPLPEEKPTIQELYVADYSSQTDWFMIYHQFQSTNELAKYILLLDRKGRIRMLHKTDFVGFPSVMSNGHIASTQCDRLVVLSPDGTEYDLMQIQPQEPAACASHHQFYVDDLDNGWVATIAARFGSGVECDLVTPTDRAVGDGILVLDRDGREIWNWDYFDHTDKIPPNAMNPTACGQHFWGADTFAITHGNAVRPVPGENALLLSLRNVSRVIKIDRDSGDILWQMGRGLDFEWIGEEAPYDKWFHFQHDPKFLSDGRFFVYDNSYFESGVWSRVLELEVDQENRTVSRVWEYRVPYHSVFGNLEIHPENANVLIGTGVNVTVIEIPKHGNPGDELFTAKFQQGMIKAEYYPSLWIDRTPPK